MKIVIDDKIPFVKGVLEPYAEVVYLPGKEISSTDVADADALIVRTRTKCNAQLLSKSSVKLVLTATIGFDHINVVDLEKLGICWSNAPGCNAVSVQNYITSALVYQSLPLEGLTLGVVGVGHVGKQVAQAGKALGMKVLLNDPPRAETEGTDDFVSLECIAKQSDIVSVHVPLERGGKYPTIDLIDKDFLTLLKPGARLFNSCRGEAVEPEALKWGRKTGILSNVVIDVWRNEPNIDLGLFNYVDISTSHIAGYSIDGKANGSAMVIGALARFFNISELLDWRPLELPPPRFESNIVLDDSLSIFDQIRTAVLHAYDIKEDDFALRKTPDKFELLRGSYPIRREFSAFTITGGSVEARLSLSQLGFNLK